VHAADGTFISLAELLRSAIPVPASAVSAIVEPLAPAPAPEPPPAQHSVPRVAFAGADACACDYAAALRDARIFRAALADAFASLAAELLDRLGAEVLGRELRLTPADVETIARRILLERRSDEPLRLRVAEADSGVACEVPVVVDPALAPGDAVLECRSGNIDARLAVRFAAVVAEASR
jgi:flagellar biosynthesis/type III secretory pathway protein FliH